MTIHKFEHLGIPDEVTQDDTKKLNESSRNTRELIAGIALLALQSFDEAQVLSEEDYAKTVAMAYRLEKTPLYKDSEDSDNASHIQQAFVLIEEYLKEQGV